MMKTLYLDIFSGISGDMFIGSLLDLGVDFEQLETELQKLGLDEYRLKSTRKSKSFIEGVKFDVLLDGDEGGESCHSHDQSADHSHSEPEPEASHDHSHSHEHSHAAASEEDHSHSHAPAAETYSHDHDHAHDHDHDHDHSHGPGENDHSHEGSRDHAQIRELIERSTLSDWVKEKSKAVFYRVAVAEGKVHGLPVESVHFHEVGAVDSIVDIVGACIGLELLGKPRVLAGAVVEGTGFVMCAHGRFPIPTMATLEILGARGVPVNQCDEPHELVTPTGAAILAEFAEDFGPMTGIVAKQVGYGLGTRDNHTRPNVLRAVLGESAQPGTAALDWETDRVAVLETNLDDISAELLGDFVDRALREGALDVFHTPIQMKKNRPGVLLSILCGETEADRFSEMILRETSAFGVRRSSADRRKLRREIVTVEVEQGTVEVKLGRLGGRVVQVSPEYESCRALAEKSQTRLKAIYEAAVQGAPRD
jgi:pyridinium-3,5-bisthiocarboxylic acid mononucleotide nickel chelatase